MGVSKSPPTGHGSGVGEPRSGFQQLLTRPARPSVPFNLDAYLADVDVRLLGHAEGRRVITRLSPLLFALLYLPHHLKSPETGDRITLSQFHLDLAESARQWVRRDIGPAELREAWVAPRGSGKSTWCFLVLPLWALAHGHRRFIAAFADSGPQAQQHLTSLKRELDTNQVFRADFPGLCAPARRLGGVTVSDSQSLYLAESGAAFMAKGIDASTLGAKVGNQRPDLLLFDDIEPDASNYSIYQKDKRLATIINAVFGMNTSAVVTIAGTTVMHGSIVHDLVRQATDPDNCPPWLAEENIRTRYYPAILTRDDGDEASLWPERWPLDYLRSIRGTRAFALNMLNQPLALDGDYWSPTDFRYDVPPAVTKRLLSIDPAVTSKTTSDYTGLAVIGYDPTAGRCVVELARQVKLAPGPLRELVLRILSGDTRIRAVLIETNQGGDAWAEILGQLPVTVIPLHQTERKEVRAARVLDHYQAGLVAHDGPLLAFEEQACAFPNVANDDVVDAVCSGVHFFLKNRRRPRRAASTVAYA